MVFKFKDGAQVPSGADAAIVHQRLVAIAKRRGETSIATITDEVEAHPDDPVLSPWFEWDTSTGMRKLHEIQAGMLVRSLVIVEGFKGQTAPVRAWVSVTAPENHHHIYQPITVVLKDADRKLELIAQVRKEFEQAQDKLNELLTIIGI